MTTVATAMMRACLFLGPGRLELREVPRPEPGPGEVVVRVRATGLCGSDLRVYRGEKGARAGVALGHEFAGEVAALGEGVAGPAVGTPVVVYPVIACGSCYFCQRGRRNRCLARRTLGYEESGGLAEYVLVPREAVAGGHVFTVPAGLPWDIASMAEPVACTLNSLETCRVGAGSTVLIMGAGPMGLIHVVLARALGAGAIVVCEPREERRAVALELGATVAVAPEEGALRQAVREASDGLGVDVAVVTAGDVAPAAMALPLVRRQGWVNLFAGAPPGSTWPLDINLVHYNEIVLTGTQNATPDHFQRTVALLPHLPALERLITHRFPLEQALEAFDARMNYEGLKAVVVME